MNARTRGITLLEVAVAITILAVVATITFVSVQKAKRSATTTLCMERINRLNSAILVYRLDFGNAEAVVGSPGFLGLPPSTYEVVLWQGKKFTNEYLYAEACPISRVEIDGRFLPHGYHYGPGKLFPSPTMWTECNRLLRGETPLLWCIAHNPPWHDLDSSYLVHEITIAALDGGLRREKIVGISAKWFDLRAYAKLRDR